MLIFIIYCHAAKLEFQYFHGYIGVFINEVSFEKDVGSNLICSHAISILQRFMTALCMLDLTTHELVFAV
jgi:hypothetical protein